MPLPCGPFASILYPMEQRILNLLAQKDYVPLSAENLQRHLRVPPDREPEFARALRKLERDGAIARIKGNRYVRPPTPI